MVLYWLGHSAAPCSGAKWGEKFVCLFLIEKSCFTDHHNKGESSYFSVFYLSILALPLGQESYQSGYKSFWIFCTRRYFRSTTFYVMLRPAWDAIGRWLFMHSYWFIHGHEQYFKRLEMRTSIFIHTLYIHYSS